VAFMVPLAGGIVEVVLSISAVTGGALYGPAIWALFSKRQTGKSILLVTGISLAINLFFKFLSPYLFDFALDRSAEMLVGMGIPFLLLFFFELYAPTKNSITDILSEEKSFETALEENKDGKIQNLFGLKVLGNSFLCVGLLLMVLTYWAESASVYMLLMGVLIAALGAWMYGFVRKEA